MNQTPIFQKTLHRLATRPDAPQAETKAPKKKTPFSQSRDQREDRGTRQIKNTGNAKSFPHRTQS
jgi:hypothetical protein